jgi:hypothetical protein
LLIPASREDDVNATLTPLQRTLDLGAGPGKTVATTLHGGVVGMVFDTRGRPTHLPSDSAQRVPLLQRWVEALSEYPEGSEA